MIQQIKCIKMILQLWHLMILQIRETHGQPKQKKTWKRWIYCPIYTHNGGSEQREGENTVNPRNGGTICPILLTGQKICQPPIKHSSFSTHTSSGWKHQESKWGQLYFPNSVTILPFLHHLMVSVYSRDTGVTVALSIWVKNPYIKKDTLLTTPQPTSMYISSSIILPVSSGWNNILSCKWLQWGLNNNIMTYMFKPFSCNISNLIMTHKCESPMAANHSMIRREGFTTHTMIRDVGQVHIKDV